jgi:hypothetical protein
VLLAAGVGEGAGPALGFVTSGGTAWLATLLGVAGGLLGALSGAAIELWVPRDEGGGAL